MRKFYSLVALLAILLAAPSVAVAQKTVTLKTSDPSLVTVMVKDYYSDGEAQTWTSGDLQVTLADWDKQLIITPVKGYEFMPGSDKKNGETWQYYGVPLEGEAITQYYSACGDGDVYEFEVHSSPRKSRSRSTITPMLPSRMTARSLSSLRTRLLLKNLPESINTLMLMLPTSI